MRPRIRSMTAGVVLTATAALSACSTVGNVMPVGVDTYTVASEKGGQHMSWCFRHSMTFNEIVSVVGLVFGLPGFVLGVLNYLRDRSKIVAPRM